MGKPLLEILDVGLLVAVSIMPATLEHSLLATPTVDFIGVSQARYSH